MAPTSSARIAGIERSIGRLEGGLESLQKGFEQAQGSDAEDKKEFRSQLQSMLTVLTDIRKDLNEHMRRSAAVEEQTEMIRKDYRPRLEALEDSDKKARWTLRLAVAAAGFVVVGLPGVVLTIVQIFSAVKKL